MNRSIRQAVASLRKARSAASWVTCLAHVTYALRQLDPRTAQSAFRKGLGAAHKAKVEGKKETQREVSKALRGFVCARSGGLCELGPILVHDGYEPHHLEGGSGRRIEKQAPENVMWTCRFHHDSYHRSPEQYRNVILAWAATHGYPTPSIFSREPRAQRAPKASPVEHAAVPRRSA